MRQHITQGKCHMFDPHRPPFVQPVAPNWLELIQSGDSASFAQQSVPRMRLTLTCQLYNLGHTRQGDLALHLQTVHADQWLRAMPNTQLLVKYCLSRYGCICNPAVTSRSLSHICPAYRQIPILHLRTEVPVCVPWTIDTELIRIKLRHWWKHPACDNLLQCLAS